MARKEQLDFIAKVAAPAQQSQQKHGIPASVTIAQCILESGWGKKALGNNFFGIKKGKANVPYVEFTTHEFKQTKKLEEVDQFRSFGSLEESVRAHGDLIAFGRDGKGGLRYAAAMAAVDDPLVYALRLKECGYSTDPDYVKKIADLMKQWDLTKFDERSKGATA
ncbi:MAG: Mannosyl-glycoprotein endo-beta-N-acetylglucosamidase [Acidobacteriaceae bacterium]|nr:Mannosyl-glycoprotein endo-beta-N-acetylglucosamidase [Acidobacteriaceae bacterium]